MPNVNLFKAFCAIFVMAFCSYGISAQAQDEAAGRYTMTPIDDGFVRLDTRTGEMAVCKQSGGQLTCEPMEDQAKEQQEQLAQLRKENEELQQEVKRLELMLNMPGQNETEPPTSNFTLPTEKQVDEALDYFENIMRNIKERLERLEKGTGEPADPETRQL